MTGNRRPLMHFKGYVMHVAHNSGFGLQFQHDTGINRPIHLAIDDDVVGVDFHRSPQPTLKSPEMLGWSSLERILPVTPPINTKARL